MLHVTHQPLYGMLLRRASTTSKPVFYRGTTKLNPRTFRSKPDSSTSAQKEILSQKLSQTTPSTTFFGRTQQWLQEWWYKGKTKIKQKIVGKTAQDILEEIKKEPLKAMDSFDTFMVKNNQNAVDELLDGLIFSNENDKNDAIKFLEFLELIITTYALNPKTSTYVIIEKIINWASGRAIDLLKKSASTHDLIIDLLSLDSDKKLTLEIVKNYEFISTTNEGSDFINRIMKEQSKNNSDISQQQKQNWLEKTKKMIHEKWKNTLSSVEKKYDISAPSTLKKQSLEQWKEQRDKAVIDLKQRINDKKKKEIQIAREQAAKE